MYVSVGGIAEAIEVVLKAQQNACEAGGGVWDGEECTFPAGMTIEPVTAAPPPPGPGTFMTKPSAPPPPPPVSVPKPTTFAPPRPPAVVGVGPPPPPPPSLTLPKAKPLFGLPPLLVGAGVLAFGLAIAAAVIPKKKKRAA